MINLMISLGQDITEVSIMFSGTALDFKCISLDVRCFVDVYYAKK